MSRTALGPTQPPIHWVPGALSLGVRWPAHEADHSPLSSVEIKNAWSYTSTLLSTSLWHGAYLRTGMGYGISTLGLPDE
jgi:hypothetical protein